MAFELYIPENLEFRDYVAIVQSARTWADGYDKKDASRLYAILADKIEIDYARVSTTIPVRTCTPDEFVAEMLSPNLLGRKALLTQHILGQPYFKHVSSEEIVVEFQQIAGHGKWCNDDGSGKVLKKLVDVTSDGKSYMEQRYIKQNGVWKLARVRPSLLYEIGEFKWVFEAES